MFLQQQKNEFANVVMPFKKENLWKLD